MPFQKGTTAWKQSLEARKDNKTKLEGLLIWLASSGAEGYFEKLEQLKSKKELSEPEREFMDRVEFWAEFITPKLARTESKHEVDGAVSLEVIFKNTK